MANNPKEYPLQKPIWTEEDFDEMNWHDAPVYGLSFLESFELAIDIDYFFKWELHGKHYKFWTSPCTIIFENVHELSMEASDLQLTVDFISRENPVRARNADFIEKTMEFDWSIELHHGIIAFKSVGYRQYIRQRPVLISQQRLDMKERGGISFEPLSFSV